MMVVAAILVLGGSALAQIDAWLSSPSVVLLAEAPGYWPVCCWAALFWGW